VCAHWGDNNRTGVSVVLHLDPKKEERETEKGKMQRKGGEKGVRKKGSMLDCIGYQ
jgi:hypothetical protein